MFRRHLYFCWRWCCLSHSWLLLWLQGEGHIASKDVCCYASIIPSCQLVIFVVYFWWTIYCIMSYKHIYRGCVRAAWIMLRDRLYSTEMKRDVCILHWSCPVAFARHLQSVYILHIHTVEFWDSSEFPLNSVCSSCAWQPSSSLCDCSLGLICVSWTFSLVNWII